MTKILVFGAEGMLGHKVTQALQDFNTTGTVRGSTPHPVLTDFHIKTLVDVRYWSDTYGVLEFVQPEVIVNCVGLIKQRNPNVADSIAVNALFPYQLAEYCKRKNARFIHISTDCVFNGQRGEYSETDLPNAIDIYGRSKALGEIRDDHSLTLRTSLIGRELSGHRSLLDWYLSQDKPVSGYTQAFFSGVTTNWLAETVRELITDHSYLTGLYNVASQRISKCDLLALVASIYGTPMPVPDDSLTIDRSLDGTVFAEATGIRTESWETMVTRMAADPTPYDA